MSEEIVKLNIIIEQCRKHVQRLDYAFSQIVLLLPFSVENVDKLKDEDISHLDQYIFRFSKLQDAIGQKLFPVVLAVLGEEAHQKPFVDVFNRLEQLEIIEDYAGWQELRIIRNEIAHDYNENKQELAEKMNKILNKKNALEKYFNDIVDFLEKRN